MKENPKNFFRQLESQRTSTISQIDCQILIMKLPRIWVKLIGHYQDPAEIEIEIDMVVKVPYHKSIKFFEDMKK